ncbi:50S ribosomal protein L25 [Acidimicrobiia bacterium EGI L10123]|uniref:50S ribosomal protein L25 n=1 Tax=Salinilacustrithrix flava TaxID=2957203 RepID=UPI003D7C2B99|nr:50S ribosomal protein L25 [Acidimicrobiia bacterium EGI L10123]
MAADQIILTAETGRPTGSRSSRRLRAEGKIPAVVYGLDTEPKPIAVEWSELRAALVTDAGMNALIDLDVDGEKKLTMVYDMQRHPVRRDVTHVDFILIDVNKTIDVDVPIVLADSDDDHLKGLVIDQNLFMLEVSAKPGTIPNEFLVDLSSLTVDEPIRAGQIELPDGVELLTDPEDAVVVASVPMSEEELLADVEEVAGDVDEPTEGEAAEGEDGAEAEGGDDAEASADEGGEEA